MNYNALTFTFITSLCLAKVPIVHGSRFCQWSSITAQAVRSCPQNKFEMERRAKIKNCKRIARIQNCTAPEKFKYHCVMNELETEFVEVCAPQYYVHGYCTEYNSLGAAIQEHFSLKCSDVEPPCKTSYLSTDAYLYKGCYEKVSKKLVTSATEFTTASGIQTSSFNEKLENIIVHLLMIALTGTFVVAVFILYICLKSKKPKAALCKLVKNENNPAKGQFMSL